MGVQSYRVRKLIREVEEGRLEVTSFFQRRQVWTNRDKEFFIDTVLKQYPCPEIFIATSSQERNSLKYRTWLVDGKQRVTTLIDYFEGSPHLQFREIKAFADLSEDDQAKFLDYEVAVRDLGSVSEDEIREIFRRINATDYALKSMEVLNAMFSGQYKQYCEALSRQPFFVEHNVFPPAYRRRMYDVTFCVILVTTLLVGYYRRDERNAEFLERYNDDFPQLDEIQGQLDLVFDFVNQCQFGEDSRAWKQTDLFTLLVELHKALAVDRQKLDPPSIGRALSSFYSMVDDMYKSKRLPKETDIPAGQEEVFQYLKASTKATNDKYARIARAEIIARLIQSTQGLYSKPSPVGPSSSAVLGSEPGGNAPPTNQDRPKPGSLLESAEASGSSPAPPRRRNRKPKPTS